MTWPLTSFEAIAMQDPTVARLLCLSLYELCGYLPRVVWYRRGWCPWWRPWLRYRGVRSHSLHSLDVAVTPRGWREVGAVWFGVGVRDALKLLFAPMRWADPPQSLKVFVERTNKIRGLAYSCTLRSCNLSMPHQRSVEMGDYREPRRGRDITRALWGQRYILRLNASEKVSASNDDISGTFDTRLLNPQHRRSLLQPRRRRVAA